MTWNNQKESGEGETKTTEESADDEEEVGAEDN